MHPVGKFFQGMETRVEREEAGSCEESAIEGGGCGGEVKRGKKRETIFRSDIERSDVVADVVKHIPVSLDHAFRHARCPGCEKDC